jgi:hypothetical protein
MGAKLYVHAIVDDYSCYSWVFFLERKDEVFEHFRSLALRLNNEHPNSLKAILLGFGGRRLTNSNEKGKETKTIKGRLH